MKITVEHQGTKIIVDEDGNSSHERLTSMKWGDQNKNIQETIEVMAMQIIKLLNSEAVCLDN